MVNLSEQPSPATWAWRLETLMVQKPRNKWWKEYYDGYSMAHPVTAVFAFLIKFWAPMPKLWQWTEEEHRWQWLPRYPAHFSQWVCSSFHWVSSWSHWVSWGFRWVCLGLAWSDRSCYRRKFATIRFYKSTLITNFPDFWCLEKSVNKTFSPLVQPHSSSLVCHCTTDISSLTVSLARLKR